MSKSKTTTDKVIDGNINSGAGQVSLMANSPKPTKMGLTRFLQLHPQNVYVVALLQKYKNKAYTEDEWFALIDQLLNARA